MRGAHSGPEFLKKKKKKKEEKNKNLMPLCFSRLKISFLFLQVFLHKLAEVSTSSFMRVMLCYIIAYLNTLKLCAAIALCI